MIYVCADDYGISENADRRIKQCVENGALNKISVFPNGVLEETELPIAKTDLRLSLHINLVEGKSVSKPENIKLLVSEDGYFKNSFVGLLFLSLSSKRKEFEAQVYEEIKSQLEWWKKKAPSAELLIDSHQHTHMIPAVFKALMRAVKENQADVKYLRIPAEPVLPYLKEPSLYLTYLPVNIIKQWLLKLLGVINRKELEKSGIATAYFMGILFSGSMDKKRVLKILPHYKKLADKNKMDIEILFHPGYMESGDEIPGKRKKTFEKFYFSRGRKTEFDAVMHPLIKKSVMKEECSNAIH